MRNMSWFWRIPTHSLLVTLLIMYVYVGCPQECGCWFPSLAPSPWLTLHLPIPMQAPSFYGNAHQQFQEENDAERIIQGLICCFLKKMVEHFEELAIFAVGRVGIKWIICLVGNCHCFFCGACPWFWLVWGLGMLSSLQPKITICNATGKRWKIHRSIRDGNGSGNQAADKAGKRLTS